MYFRRSVKFSFLVQFLFTQNLLGQPNISKPFGFDTFYQEGSPQSYFKNSTTLVSIFPKGIYGNETSGYSFGAKISPSLSKTISYEVLFPEDFNFVKGGKLPGLCGGKVASGGKKADGYNGFSSRVMWRKDGRIASYVYHVNQKDRYGDDFQWNGADIAPIFIKRGIWHNIKLTIRMNEIGRSDGFIQAYFDNNLVFEKKDFVFRKTDKIQVDVFCFNTFFGGGDHTWAPTKAEKLFIRNLKIEEASVKEDRPEFFTKFANEIGNICQTCHPKIIKWRGKPHCGPAAVSNNLFWISKNGFPQIMDGLEDQAELVNKLGQVMGTTEHGGTSPYKILNGLKEFLESKNVPIKFLASVGKRSVPDFVRNEGKKISLDWIKDGIASQNSVWLLIGWAKYDSKTAMYQIFDGHWLTVVGYGKDRQGNANPNILVVHDPAERAERKNYYPEMSEISKIQVDSEEMAGVLSMTGDVIIKPGAEIAIIQGAYQLGLK